jgi:hypothetical protein
VTLLYACSQATTEADVELTSCSCDLENLEVPIDDLIDAASDALFIVSGGIVTGRCTTTYRPCNTYCTCWPSPCACGSCEPQGIPLPGVAPTVTQVKIDGDVFTDWAVVNWHYLVRTDGDPWPTLANQYLPDTEDNTFSVTVESGLDWTMFAKMAANELVCEFAKLISGRETMLPAGTVSAVMDGISVQVARLPGQEEIEAVGLTWLAKFIGTYSTRVMSEVRSPELDQGWILNVVEFAP